MAKEKVTVCPICEEGYSEKIGTLISKEVKGHQSACLNIYCTEPARQELSAENDPTNRKEVLILNGEYLPAEELNNALEVNELRLGKMLKGNKPKEQDDD